MVLMRYDNLIKEDSNNSMVINIQKDIEIAEINKNWGQLKPM